MATSQPFFPVDPTGKATANRRLLEYQLLPDTNTNYVRAVSLEMGCFFTETVNVYDKVTGTELRRGIDYLFTEYYSSLSIIYKADIAATLLITNPQVNREIEVSYNFLGTLFGKTVKGFANTINAEASRREISNLQWDMLNQCKPIIPTDYARQIGAGVGFETIVFALERIRSTLMYGDFDTEITVGTFIDSFLMTVENILDQRVKVEFKQQLDAFRDSFTKELLGLGNVVNMAPLDPEMAKLAVVRNFIFDKNKDGYITIRAISRFKEELYNNLVSRGKTSIGRYQGTYGLPLLTTIYALRNGDGFIIDSLNVAKVAGYDFNDVVYPDRASPDDRWCITKITNNLQGQGGVLWGTNMTTSEVYVGTLKNGINEPEVLVWSKLYSEYDMERALEALTGHMNNRENPHKTNKHALDLGNVENYPLADANDLACRMPGKKYVTHKWVLAFLSTYMNGLKTAEDLKKMNCDENEVIRNIKLIFAPCGPCGPCCEPNIVPVTTTTSSPPVVVDPEGQLTGWYCENNKRWDILTDGFGGTKTVEHVYAPDDPAIEQDGCVKTTTTSTTPAPSNLKVFHYGDFINGDGVFFYSLVDKNMQSGKTLHFSMEITVDNGNTELVNIGIRNFGHRVIYAIVPYEIKQAFNFTSLYFDAKLVVREGSETGAVLGEAPVVRYYNDEPQINFDLFSVELVTDDGNVSGLCNTTIVDGYKDSRYVNTVDYYKQWLGYRKGEDLLEFGKWLKTANIPQPGKTEFYLNEYFASRNSTNYTKTNIDPDTGKVRPLELDYYGFFYGPDGDTLPGSPWPKAYPIRQFQMRLRISFYKNGIPTPMVSEMYYYIKEEQDPGFPMEERDEMMGAFMANITIGEDRVVKLKPGNQLTSPPFTWLSEINE